VLLLLLEWAALAYVTGAQTPPLIAGLTFSSALSAWLPTVLAVNALEWGIGIIFRDDVQVESGAGSAPEPEAAGAFQEKGDTSATRDSTAN
jgi:hypothetical protein